MCQPTTGGSRWSETTTYSFDAGGIHFVILNEYFDGVSDTGIDGDVSDATYTWLVSDLENRAEEIALVIGHEPAYVLPDIDTGRIRHEGDSVDQYPANCGSIRTAWTKRSTPTNWRRRFSCGSTRPRVPQ